MNAELAALYQVQQLDTEIARHKQALSCLDSGAELAANIAALQQELAGLRSRQAAAENDNLDTELELKTLQEKRDKFQTQLYSGTVSNPRQLSDLQEEVKMLEREIRKVEDRELELMETLESLRKEIAIRESHLTALRDSLSEVKAAYEETNARLQAELAGLEAARTQATIGITASLLKRYNAIRVRSANLGLVKVISANCPGCHIALPSDTLKALKSGRGLQSCDSCGRMLYQETPETTTEQ